MTPEQIKRLADGYYAGNADWENDFQEQSTKIGWRQGFGYALNQVSIIEANSFLLIKKVVNNMRLDTQEEIDLWKQVKSFISENKQL